MKARQPVFFLAGAVVAALLYPIADAGFRPLVLGVVSTYLVLAGAFALDGRSRDRR